MASLVRYRCGSRRGVLNADNIVDVVISEEIPAGEWWDEEDGVWRHARGIPMEVEVVTTGVDGHLTDGGDYGPSFAGTEVYAYRIKLRGEDAERFLDALDGRFGLAYSEGEE